MTDEEKKSLANEMRLDNSKYCDYLDESLEPVANKTSQKSGLSIKALYFNVQLRTKTSP